MFKAIPTTAAILAAALAGSVSAAGIAGIDAGVNANVDLKTVDKNSDGKVSKAEAASNADLSKQFDSLDANKDGNLDKAEFAKFEASGKASGKAGSSGAPATTDDTAPSSKEKP